MSSLHELMATHDREGWGFVFQALIARSRSSERGGGGDHDHANFGTNRLCSLPGRAISSQLLQWGGGERMDSLCIRLVGRISLERGWQF